MSEESKKCNLIYIVFNKINSAEVQKHKAKAESTKQATGRSISQTVQFRQTNKSDTNRVKTRGG